MITMNENLHLNEEYLMQIVEAASDIEDLGWFIRVRVEFKIRIWTDFKKPELYYEVIEVMYNNGRSAKYVIDFIWNAIGCEFRELDDEVDFTIGAVFMGCVTKKVKVDNWNRETEFYNINALEPCGYYDVD